MWEIKSQDGIDSFVLLQNMKVTKSFPADSLTTVNLSPVSLKIKTIKSKRGCFKIKMV